MPPETKPLLPISMDEPSCPPCHHDCCQGDTCPNRLQSTADYGDRELTRVLLGLVCFWLLVCAGLIWVTLR